MKFKKPLFLLLIIAFLFLGYLFIGSAEEKKDIVFGVNFSQKQAQNLGLDWKKVYSDLLYDLNVRHLKLITFWDFIETSKGVFNFDDLDWQIEQAENTNTEVVLVIGMKTGSWPECHVPAWVNGLDKGEQQERILNLIKRIVLRYKASPAVTVWMVENEPLFHFGDCPWRDKGFLKKEVELVKSLDARPVLVTDSGEWSFWIEAARLGDIVGTTMYKKAWLTEAKTYISYPFPSVFYYRKAQIIDRIFHKKVICVELQAEPWCSVPISSCSLEEQNLTMNVERFKQNIEFAKKTGFDTFYLWGGEWWYWLKENHQDAGMWEQARELF